MSALVQDDVRVLFDYVSRRGGYFIASDQAYDLPDD
jgi:hypothetical protein